MSSVALIAAGLLALLAAGIHGVVGDRIVVRRLPQQQLAPTSFGGPRMTKAMIHACWHLTTLAFLTIAVALLLSGTILDGDAAQALGLLGAAACTAFALLIAGVGLAYNQSARGLFRHPGPVVLGAAGALAWWGAL